MTKKKEVNVRCESLIVIPITILLMKFYFIPLADIVLTARGVQHLVAFFPW